MTHGLLSLNGLQRDLLMICHCIALSIVQLEILLSIRIPVKHVPLHDFECLYDI